MRFRLRQHSERESSAWFELLVVLILSTTAEHDIRSLNPYLTETAYKTVKILIVITILTSIRISQTHRALTGVGKLMILLRQAKKMECTAWWNPSMPRNVSTGIKSSERFDIPAIFYENKSVFNSLWSKVSCFWI